MGSLIATIVIVVCAGWILLRRWRGRQAHAASVSPKVMLPQNLAHQAFAHGNTCLSEGNFSEATAAFHQARERDPKHPHVAGRLAEVERQQRAAGTVTSVNSAS